jgi:hypothetical protein
MGKWLVFLEPAILAGSGPGAGNGDLCGLFAGAPADTLESSSFLMLLRGRDGDRR